MATPNVITLPKPGKPRKAAKAKASPPKARRRSGNGAGVEQGEGA